MIWRRRGRVEQEWLSPELAQLIVDGHVEVSVKQARAVDEWGIGSAESWSANLATRTIAFEFVDRVVTGEVQLLGSYAHAAGTWLWGWANDAVPDSTVEASRRVRGLAGRPGLEMLAAAKLEVPAEMADDLANIAVEAGGLDGWYRSPSDRNNVYLGFRALEAVPR